MSKGNAATHAQEIANVNAQASENPNPQAAADLAKIKDSIGTVLMRTLFEEVSRLRTPWVVTPQQTQQDMLDRMRANIDHAVAHVVRRLATGSFPAVAVEIESLSIKDDAKATLTMPRGTQEIHALTDRVKSKAILVFADPAEYAAQAEEFKAMADQPPLPLE